jgi:membrane protease YdiL (CAAX protease family)
LLGKNLSYFGVRFNNLVESSVWIAGLGSSIILVQSFAARSKSNLSQYPQIRIQEWSRALFFKNTLIWLLYLFSYEFMFRGFLLFGTVYIFGVWPGIAINTVLYSLAHVPKGAREAVMAIPFGLFICYITLRTETIWVAVFLHFALAISNDYFSIQANPDMWFKKRAA